MTFSVIQKSQLEGADRIDAEYYQSEYLNLQKSLQNVANLNLEDVAMVNGGKRLPVGELFSETGVPYLRIVNIYNTFIDLSEIKFISDRLFNKLKAYQIQNRDILVTIVGNTIGLIGYDQTDIKPFNFTENCARVRSKKYPSEYILAVLLSKIGQLQVNRDGVGAAQPKLSLDRLRKFKIPVPDETNLSTITNIITNSLVKYEDSRFLYQQAENLLLQGLGLLDFKPKEDSSYVVNYSDAEKVDRVDADYFQPKYVELLKIIKNTDFEPLLNIVEDVSSNVVLKPDENYKYIELANINSSLGIIDGYSEVLGIEAPSRARRILKTSDVIVSSIQGSLEKVALVQKEQENNLASTGFFQFRSNKVLPEVLLVLAKSVVLQWQLERECSGTILSAVPQESLKRIIIPVLPKETQTKIADLVKKSHEARKRSKELLEEAKRKVEEMIKKKGGE